MGYNSKQLKVKYHTKDAPNPKPNPYKGDKQVNPVVDKSYFDTTGNGMRDPKLKALAQQFGIPVTIPGNLMGTDGYGNDMPLRVTPNYADGSQGPEYTKYPNTGNHSFPGAVSFTERMASGGQTNSDIARAILEDDMVYGHSLTDSQREHMAKEAGVELDEDGNIVEAENTDTGSTDDTAELDNARRGGQKKRRSKTSSNPVTGINDLMMRNETIYGQSGRKRFVPKLKQGGWLDKYDDGGETGMLPYKMGGNLNKYQTKGEVNTLEGDLISKVIMNRNRDKDFVQRAYAVGEYPDSNMFVQPDANQFGNKNSHLMAYGEDDNGQSYMFPTIFNDKNEVIKVPNQYADYISSVGYKNATGIPIHQYGGVQKFQPGGGVNVPTIEYTNEMGSQYDPVIQTSYINPKDPEQAKIHELWHHYQNVNNWNRSYDSPMMKKPQTPASDEMLQEYYNRASNEANELTKGFKQRYPEFNMVPDDVIYNRQVENQMYDQPWTLEGEGRAVESPEGRQWLSDEGYDMQEFEDLANRSGISYPKKQMGGWLSKAQYGKIQLQDKRFLDPISGDPLKQTSRKGYTVDSALVDDLIQRSYKAGVNPNTTLAMGLQETGLGQGGWGLSKNNPLHLNKTYQEEKEDYLGDTFKLLQEKNKLADRLGKTDDASKIQAWNGYGTDWGGDNKMYGMDKKDMLSRDVPADGAADGSTAKNYGINMAKNPIYGKTIVNLRDSIIAQNPQIQAMVKKYKPKQVPYAPTYGKNPQAQSYGYPGSLAKQKMGGWLDHYQDGGTVSELWEQKTGTPWSEAKKQGLTDGSYEGNIKVRDMLVKGNISKPKPKVISTKPRSPRIDSSLMGQPNFASETVQSQAPLSKYAAAEQNKAAVKDAIQLHAENVYNKHLEKEALKKKYPTKNQEEIQKIQDKIESPWLYEPAGQLASYLTTMQGLSDDEIANITGKGTMGNRLDVATNRLGWGLANEVSGEIIGKGLEYASPYIKKGLNTAGKVLDTSFDVTKSVPVVYRDSQFKNKLTIGFGKSKQTFNNSIEWKKAFDAERAAGVERPLLKKEINFLNKEIKDRGILEIDRRHPLDPRQPLVKRGLLPEDYDMKKAVKDFIPNLIKGDVKSQYTMGIGRENAFNQYLRMPTKDNMYRIHPESFTNGNEMIYTVPHNKLVQLSKNNAKAGVSSFAPSKASMQELQIAKESLTNNSKEFNKKAYDVIKKRMEQSYDNDAIEEILGPKNKFVYDITNPDYGADMSGGMSRIKNGTSYINDLDLYTNAHGNAYWENKNIPGSRNQSWKMIDTWDINPFSRMTNKPKWVQNLDVAPIMGAKNFTLNLDYITTPSGITKPLIPKKLGGWLDKYK